MLGMSAFNKKPRQYSYKPMYYNPEEEARKEREQRYEPKKDEKYVPGSYIHSQRVNRIMGLDRPQKSTLDRNKTLIRLIIVILLSLVVGYGIIKSDLIVRMVEGMTR